MHKRSLVVIFSDMFENDADQEALFAAMQHLKHNKHEVILFHVTDKATEESFVFENRPYIFIDKETGQQIKANYSNVKDAYITSMRKYKQDLLIRCGQYGIDFVEADIKEGYKQVLLPYLLKRQRLV